MDHISNLDGHIPLTKTSRLDEVLPVNVPVRFNGIFPTQGPYPPPTFDSWAIRRRYALELKAVVECLGDVERFKIQ